MITYNSICEKLGFDLMKGEYKQKVSDFEDDSIVSPFSVLTDDESNFLFEYLLENRYGIKQ